MSTSPPPRDTAALGSAGEALAAETLTAAGLEIVARNWRLSTGAVRGELDLVALDHREGVVVVCEVKTRRGDAYGGPLAALTAGKQARIRRLALALLASAELPYRRLRFDVVAVTWQRGTRPAVAHLPGAF